MCDVCRVRALEEEGRWVDGANLPRQDCLVLFETRELLYLGLNDDLLRDLYREIKR
jgi:hypothetical protein